MPSCVRDSTSEGGGHKVRAGARRGYSYSYDRQGHDARRFGGGTVPNCVVCYYYRARQTGLWNECLAAISRASRLRSIHVSKEPGKLERGVDDAANALSGHETGRHSVAIHVEGAGISPHPHPGYQGSDRHRGAVHGGRDDESEGHDHHVRMILPHPLPAAGPETVPDQNHHTAEQGEFDGEEPAGFGNGKSRVCHGHGHGVPGRHRRCGEGTNLSIRVVDAWGRGGEQDENTRGNEDGEKDADALGEPLEFCRSAREETDSEVACDVCLQSEFSRWGRGKLWRAPSGENNTYQ
jgi:hypothetical protein